MDANRLKSSSAPAFGALLALEALGGAVRQAKADLDGIEARDPVKERACAKLKAQKRARKAQRQHRKTRR